MRHQGIALNADGGLVKRSPDGLLLQSSTIADSLQCAFECGATAAVPGEQFWNSVTSAAQCLTARGRPQARTSSSPSVSFCHRRDHSMMLLMRMRQLTRAFAVRASAAARRARAPPKRWLRGVLAHASVASNEGTCSHAVCLQVSNADRIFTSTSSRQTGGKD